KARATAARRKGRERQVERMPEPAAADPHVWDDLQPLLDEALGRLPAKYRVLIVLCDLEGKTRKEAAQQLGVPEGTVAGRLARARALLTRRLARRGIALSSGSLAVLLSQQAASASVPPSVVSATIQTATLVGTGRAVAEGVIPAQVAVLTEGVLQTMLVMKLKLAAAFLLAAGVLAAVVGASGLAGGTPAAEHVAAGPKGEKPPAAPKQEQPARGGGADAEDPLRAARDRMVIEEQRLSQVVDGNLREARKRSPG